MTHETDIKVSYVSQISRLTWFTRFDPVKITEVKTEDGDPTTDNSLHHDKGKRHGSVTEHTNGVFPFY